MDSSVGGAGGAGREVGVGAWAYGWGFKIGSEEGTGTPETGEREEGGGVGGGFTHVKMG